MRTLYGHDGTLTKSVERNIDTKAKTEQKDRPEQKKGFWSALSTPERVAIVVFIVFLAFICLCMSLPGANSDIEGQGQIEEKNSQVYGPSNN